MERPPPVPADPRAVWSPVEPPPAPRRLGPIIGAIAAILIGAIVAVALVRYERNGAVSEVKAGWSRETVPSQGFAVDLPPGWNSVSTSSADDAYNALKGANPQLASLVKDQLGSSLSSLIKFLAFDIRSPTLAQQFATNMNIVVAPVVSGVDFDAFVNQNVAELRRTPGIGKTIDSQRLTLPAGEAALVSSRLTVNAPGGPQEVAITQYLLLNGPRGYIVSFSTLPSYLAAYADRFRNIADTFRYV